MEKRKEEQVMARELTRDQFKVLETLATSKIPLTEYQFLEDEGLSKESIVHIIKKFIHLGYISDGIITETGIKALEPYRVRRAVFIAAGFGTRLVPITLNTPKPLIRVHGRRIIDSAIDACLAADINEIYIVRGHLAEQFDQLLYKYPMIKFLENFAYTEANNISSAMVARNLISNAYVFEADLLVYNPKIIRKYHYASNFIGIKKSRTDDWCFTVKDGIIIEEKVGGSNCWQMVGISYWNKNDGDKLFDDIGTIYEQPDGKVHYWEQVPLVFCKDHYRVEIRECFDNDVIEIDTYDELRMIDKAYNV